jgi:hypothetical protein
MAGDAVMTGWAGFSKGEWGKEERKSNPWKKGEDIDLRIRAHDSKFTIFADQKELKEYEHRVPLSSISHFSIDGDVFVSDLLVLGRFSDLKRFLTNF